MKKTEKGFTIIEVALVLAIGALIFLVVFLAVPALQRNQRNDARKRDISNIVEAVHDYNANHPTGQMAGGTVYDANGPKKDDTKNNLLGNYLDNLSSSTDEVEVYDSGSGNLPPITGNGVQTNKIHVYKGRKCNGLDGVEQGSGRQAAVMGTMERSGGYTLYCQDAS